MNVAIRKKLKKQASIEAIKYIKKNMIVGIGTGSTVSYFIKELEKIKKIIKGTISTSYDSTFQLIKYKIPIIEPNQVKNIDIYVDSVDEIDKNLIMIKGGGGALTKEKIILSMSKKILIIADKYKMVKKLGSFPIPIEIIPIAKSFVSKKLHQLNGIPKYRKKYITENGNIIIDFYKPEIFKPIELEKKINSIPGVVTVGLFTKRKADILILSTKKGIKTLTLKDSIKIS